MRVENNRQATHRAYAMEDRTYRGSKGRAGEWRRGLDWGLKKRRQRNRAQGTRRGSKKAGIKEE